MSKYLEESYNEALRENLALIEQNKKLLAKLEIAEKALENIGDMIGEEFAEKTKERCSQALQQIRE